MRRKLGVMVLAIGLGAFTVAGVGSVAMAKECKAGQKKFLHFFCKSEKCKKGEKKAETKPETKTEKKTEKK
jgi:hypothetical protein